MPRQVIEPFDATDPLHLMLDGINLAHGTGQIVCVVWSTWNGAIVHSGLVVTQQQYGLNSSVFTIIDQDAPRLLFRGRNRKISGAALQSIAKVADDLADGDKFKCVRCDATRDIEDSIQTLDGLMCDTCWNRV